MFNGMNLERIHVPYIHMRVLCVPSEGLPHTNQSSRDTHQRRTYPEVFLCSLSQRLHCSLCPIRLSRHRSPSTTLYLPLFLFLFLSFKPIFPSSITNHHHEDLSLSSTDGHETTHSLPSSSSPTDEVLSSTSSPIIIFFIDLSLTSGGLPATVYPSRTDLSLTKRKDLFLSPSSPSTQTTIHLSSSSPATINIAADHHLLPVPSPSLTTFLLLHLISEQPSSPPSISFISSTLTAAARPLLPTRVSSSSTSPFPITGRASEVFAR